MKPQPTPPLPGQESVWSYPRPPALEPVTRCLRIVHGGQVVAETRNAYRVLETSHPPVYYFPPPDCRIDWLSPAAGASFCEWKGTARYVDLAVPRSVPIAGAGWYYQTPGGRFRAIAGYLAFYPQKVDQCTVDEMIVTPQPGNFYGGWITPDLAGPFKGVAGSMHW